MILSLLDANGGNLHKTSTETGVPATTIEAWIKGWRCPQAMNLHREKAGILAKASEEIAWSIAALIPSKLHEATLPHLTHAFATMVDKTRLLQGLSTTIVDVNGVSSDAPTELIELYQHMTPDERDAVRVIYERAASRRDDPLIIQHPAAQPIQDAPAFSSTG
jgi:hypothetical protein